VTDDCCELVVTAPDGEWLANLTTELVQRRLAASSSERSRTAVSSMKSVVVVVAGCLPGHGPLCSLTRGCDAAVAAI
jgi:hypothetical protein